MRRLFLDDIRGPEDCVTYMHRRIQKDNAEYLKDWDVVKNYDSFVLYIKAMGIPDIVSFDHDLADIHYDPKTWTESFEYHEETGYDCLKWLCEYCSENNLALPEKIFFHTANPVGEQNMKQYLENYKEHGTAIT